MFDCYALNALSAASPGLREGAEQVLALVTGILGQILDLGQEFVVFRSKLLALLLGRRLQRLVGLVPGATATWAAWRGAWGGPGAVARHREVASGVSVSAAAGSRVALPLRVEQHRLALVDHRGAESVAATARSSLL